MVCTVDPTCTPTSGPHTPTKVCGNATTCLCQSWQYFKYSTATNTGAAWYCEVGPGWKPDAVTVAAEQERRRWVRDQLEAQQEEQGADGGAEHEQSQMLVKGLQFGPSELGWVPPANPYVSIWRPAPLVAASTASSVQVDLTGPALKGLQPVSVRYAWVLFVRVGGGDTCCPTAAVQGGHGACIPGNCPLYSETSELPANPFFATIDQGSGKCKCMAPQDCSA